MRRVTILCVILLMLTSLPALAQPRKTTSVITISTPTNKTLVKKSPVRTPLAKKTVVKKANTVKKTSRAIVNLPVVKAKPPVNRNISLDECNMSTREKQMVNEINLVRSDPTGYVKYIKDYIKKTEGISKETKSAAKELVDELKKMKPLSPLSVSPALYVDAREYGKELMETNVIAHSSLPYNENLSFGIESVRDVIIDLLIDDNVDDRGHRRNILKKNITLCAVHEIPGKVEDFQFCYIQEFK